MKAVEEAVQAGARRQAGCDTLGISSRTLQRWKAGALEDLRGARHVSPANKLSEGERRKLHALVNSEEMRNLSPAQIVPRLADTGVYVASEATMYRLLRSLDELCRRDGTRGRTARTPRSHLATAINQVWCWDISYLPGPRRGTHYFLYLVVDLFSRRVMGAEVHAVESASLASAFVQRLCTEQHVDSEKLVLHSDNGGPMKGTTMLETLRWLGITASFSRPYVSDDNAYVESIFRTLKYRPGFPRGGFPSHAEAIAWVDTFVAWYNLEHRHSGIRFVSPEQRYRGEDVAILANRHRVYLAARAANPKRWTGATRDWSRPTKVRLNRLPDAS